MDASPHPVPTAGRTPPRRGPRLAPAVAAVCGLLTVAGCGGGGTGDATAETGRSGTDRPSAGAKPTPRPATVEQLASAVGCKPRFTVDVDDYRQAVCTTSRGKFLLLDFARAKGQRDWLETARMYGGVYLIGNRWVLSASPRKNMDELRKQFGGTIEDTTSSHGETPRER
ncbi:hypothetical protein HUT19_04790 [Streptomyces sp. NA02950]|uniref:hypothetical protein n=1 Tax=Streptomyces sp. NA02950 TaxID=2742137 RepID=UPI00158FE67A|nr:hypothetical protein [Streptomyces sp. NA02950]QKV91142.1 hypothetical protein HUT19_04790 [Streptomyces sp. NA02950]